MSTKRIFPILIVFCTLIACRSTTETLIVGPSKVPCEGLSPQDCLQVKKDSAAAWENFYGTIEGFDYEPGYQYTLMVDVTKNKSAAADSSSIMYSLKEVLDKKKIDVPQEKLDGSFAIDTFEDKNVSDEKMTINFNAETGQVYGKGVCNRFSGTFVTAKGKIKFSQAATTRMMCQKPDLERDFFRKLNAVDGFKINGGQLTISEEGKPVLTATHKETE